ncbi:MAG: hypothetical protein LBT47_08715 [Deltaproteobacteria bacterium]|nr:hypothetical protein [Deltaproteobacteria bacterium]
MTVNEELVTKITEEIFRRLSAVSSPQKAGQAKIPVSTELLVVGPLEVLPTGVVQALKDNFQITVIDSFDQPDVPGAQLLMTSLGLQPLVRVPYGDEGCTIEGRALLRALLEGRQAVVWDGGIQWRRYQCTAPKLLISGYLASEAALKGAGVRIVSDSAILTALSSPPCCRPSQAGISGETGHRSGPELPAWSGAGQKDLGQAAPAAPCGGGRVLTEAKIKQLCPTGPGVFTLAPGDVLTPLALDYLSASKIVVRKP